MKQPNEVPPLAEFWHDGDSILDPAWYYRDDGDWFFLLPKLNPKATGKWCLTVNPPSEMRRVVKHENHSADTTDMVNNPPHYKQGDIECIDAIRAALTPEEFRGYCKGNMLKYIWRERHKGGDESMKKAEWYGRQAVDASTR